MSVFKWLQDWYLQNCDGDWEHCYGVEISTLDNPGWTVDIDLTDTNLEDKNFKTVKIDRSENDWIHCCIKDDIFKGSGGPLNLEEIIEIFKVWCLDKDKSDVI